MKRLFKRKRKFPVSIQIDTKDCGPACLQIICRHYGIYKDIEYLREISGARKEGCTIHDLVSALEKLRIKSVPLRTSYKKLVDDIPLPCIAYWRGNHYIVVYKVTPKYVYVSDPRIGLIKYKKRDFVRGWLGYIREKDSWRKGVLIAIEPTADFKQNISSSPKPNHLEALRYVWSFVKPYKKNVYQILLILFILTFIGALLPVITQTIIDVGILAKDIGFITLLISSALVLNISSSLATWVQQSINTHFSSRIKVSMLSDYLDQLFKLPLTFFESRLMGDLLQRSHDYDRIESLILYSTFNTILGLLSFVVFGAILFIYNSLLFYIYIALSILYIIWTLLFLSVRRRMDIKYFSFISQNHSHWMELLSNILDIKSYSYGKNKRWQWEKTQIGLYKTKIKLLNVDQIEALGRNLINSSKDLIIMFIAASSVIKGEMTFGILIAIQYIVGQLNAPLNNIVQFITTMQMSYIGFVRISEINKAKTEYDGDFHTTELIDFSQNIIFTNVYYKYSINEEYVLKSLKFIIPKNKVTAIVGASGSGKSTIIKLLMNLYAPTIGSIAVGNIRLASINVDDWRGKCGVITQESTLFKDTILNNIIFGRPYESEKLLEAVKIANIQQEIEILPSGYKTMLGENGRGLSAGQKQRILFARAIYNKPEYIFMDEVTSTLDSSNEEKIIHSFKSELKDSTVVIAAHRLSSVVDADIIIVLSEGSVVEVGNHQLLMQAGKTYFNLFQSQIQS